MPPSPSRRALLGGLSLLAVAPALAACGGADEAIGGSGPGPGAEAGALPVTIEHKYGSTRITKAPQRVVSIGLVEQDALLALGVVPVADTKWYGEAKSEIYPWATRALGSADLPVELSDADGVQIEKIAALRPDLIIGQYAGLKQRDYELLSKIAPTVAQPEGVVDYGAPWDESTLTIAKALGRPRDGKNLVAKVRSQITDAAHAHPAFAGKTAVVVTPYEGLFVYGPDDPRGRLLTQLGFTFPNALLRGRSDEFGWSLSAERVGDLADVDVVVWLDYGQAPKGMRSLFEQSAAYREGRWFDVGTKQGAYYVGLGMVTPLSIPYVLKRYVPQLAAAVDGKAATKVPAVSS